MTILKGVLMAMWIFCFYQATVKNLEIFVFAKLRKEIYNKSAASMSLILTFAASVFFAVWFYL